MAGTAPKYKISPKAKASKADVWAQPITPKHSGCYNLGEDLDQKTLKFLFEECGVQDGRIIKE